MVARLSFSLGHFCFCRTWCRLFQAPFGTGAAFSHALPPSSGLRLSQPWRCGWYLLPLWVPTARLAYFLTGITQRWYGCWGACSWRSSNCAYSAFLLSVAFKSFVFRRRCCFTFGLVLSACSWWAPSLSSPRPAWLPLLGHGWPQCGTGHRIPPASGDCRISRAVLLLFVLSHTLARQGLPAAVATSSPFPH